MKLCTMLLYEQEFHHACEGIGAWGVERPSTEEHASVSGCEFKSQCVNILHLDFETMCIQFYIENTIHLYAHSGFGTLESINSDLP